MTQYAACIAAELGIRVAQVEAVAALLADGGTVPFIARYRKEATDSLDEVVITAIRDRLEQLAELDKRREAILASLVERELLTDELKTAIEAALTLAELEDIYLPYRPKRRTRATIAREKGLEPLATILASQDASVDPVQEAARFIDIEKGVADIEEALQGARDILAETFSEDAETRQAMRQLFLEKGAVQSSVVKGKDVEGVKFRDYFAWSESLSAAPGHRVLAMFRGEAEGVLKLSVRPPEESALAMLRHQHVRGDSPAALQVSMAVEDGYGRLLAPSMENEARAEAKFRADEEAIRVFADNLRELLMASPLGEKAVLALDPGFRTGSKVVCLDAQGALRHNTTIFISQSERAREEAASKIRSLVEQYQIEAIAIGNGTASRETEAFVRSLKLPASIIVTMVNESGASIYSASEIAREEFPDHDLTVRGSVSIGRRLMDPLAELVKLDPKSIGVGQYQHDVDQGRLKKSLDDVVMHCVNSVGVEVNTASARLLTYVAGLGPSLAKNVVAYRTEHGPFRSRAEIKKVPRLGPKAFEQCAGFLRIRDGKHPLDQSAVHPERYKLVETMAKDQGCTVADLMADPEKRSRLDLKAYVGGDVGLPTLEDIVQELARPGRDPREAFEAFSFDDAVHEMADLTPGMMLPGIVTNVTKFGAFVDVGVHQDGLVHISQLADHFVSDPADVVKVQQRVTVRVVEVDLERRRIALSMKSDAAATALLKGETLAGAGSMNAAERNSTGAKHGAPARQTGGSSQGNAGSSRADADSRRGSHDKGRNWLLKNLQKKN